MQNILNILSIIKKMDKKIVRFIDIGLWISFLISVIGTIILIIHYKIYISAELYYIGIEIFKIGIISAVSIIGCSCGLWVIKEKMK